MICIYKKFLNRDCSVFGAKSATRIITHIYWQCPIWVVPLGPFNLESF